MRIGGKASTNVPLRKMYHFFKSSALTCMYGPIYLQLDDSPPYYDKTRHFGDTHEDKL